MSECKRTRCEEEAACSYNNDYCSSTCEIMQLRKENAELREAARDMLQLLINNAPGDGLHERMVEDWGMRSE